LKSGNRLSPALRRTLGSIRLVIMDSDGVLTDGRIIFGSDGTDYRCFHTHDGFGLVRALRLGLNVAVISGSTSATLARRMKPIGVKDVIQGKMDKVSAYRKLRKKYRLADSEVAFIGDDEFDMPLLKIVGFSAAPADAIAKVRRSVDYVTKAGGGKGAVRELLDLVLNAQGKLDL
jgi:3-deoxy-D-manno-octulosonate 8-phosphate phosphatase (KDO 8-P phosphatase)